MSGRWKSETATPPGFRVALANASLPGMTDKNRTPNDVRALQILDLDRFD